MLYSYQLQLQFSKMCKFKSLVKAHFHMPILMQFVAISTVNFITLVICNSKLHKSLQVLLLVNSCYSGHLWGVIL